jgi:hypothetical protein
MRTRIQFDYNNIQVIAQAIVTNGGIVTRLNLYYPDIEESEWPRSKKLVDDIKETAEILLLEQAHNPELAFYE